MRKIRLTENQLHQVIKESVNKILTEISGDKVLPVARKLNRLGQYGDHGNRPDSYQERHDKLVDNYKDVYGKELDDGPTPEEFFDNLCYYAKDGILLKCGWFVDANLYGGDELFFYENENDDEYAYRFSDDEKANYNFETDNNGDRSVVEELYMYGKYNNFDEMETLNNFANDMLNYD